MTTTATMDIEYLAHYQGMLAHQRAHDGLLLSPLPGQPEQPFWWCQGCLRELRDEPDGRKVRKRYSFAIPSERALAAIAQHSPGGVVEIGAGGGYWAMLLQQRGVDVIAFDPSRRVTETPTGT